MLPKYKNFLLIFWNRSHQSSSNDIDEEEYSNSSRLHLAGDNSAVVESFYQSVGGGMKLHSCAQLVWF